MQPSSRAGGGAADPRPPGPPASRDGNLAEELRGGGAPAGPRAPHARRPRQQQQQRRRRVLSLKLSMRRRKTGLLDAQLRGYLRERLRLLANDDREARAVFSELSARLLSVDAEEHLVVVTFWTFEEIWKFETYYSLGFLKHCMENLLLDDYFWLFTQEEEEAAGIDVCLNEECLDMIYRDLLIQEGAFFVCHPEDVISERRASYSGGRISRLNWAEGASEATEWDALTSRLPKPLAPFHQ